MVMTGGMETPSPWRGGSSSLGCRNARVLLLFGIEQPESVYQIRNCHADKMFKRCHYQWFWKKTSDNMYYISYFSETILSGFPWDC